MALPLWDLGRETSREWCNVAPVEVVLSVMLEELPASPKRRDGRVAEGARLESVYTARYPGFESLSLRQTFL